jgi:hypothetical protein
MIVLLPPAVHARESMWIGTSPWIATETAVFSGGDRPNVLDKVAVLVALGVISILLLIPQMPDDLILVSRFMAS